LIPIPKRRFTNSSSFFARLVPISCPIHHRRMLFNTPLFNGVDSNPDNLLDREPLLHLVVLYYPCHNKAYIFYSLASFQKESLQIPHRFPAFCNPPSHQIFFLCNHTVEAVPTMNHIH
jgi:hypothetical protein